jgi:hypothetical protein
MMTTLEVLTALPNESATRRPWPLLLIHGAWHGAWCWADNFLPYFADRGYASYALSLRGHGKSPGNARFATTGQYLSDIRHVAQNIAAQHGGQHPVLIGHSMGGYLTQRYLQTYDEAPAAVLLGSIPHFGSLPFFLRYLRMHPLSFFRVFLTFSPYHMVASPERARALFFSPDYPEENLQALHPLLCNESLLVSLESASVGIPRPGRIRAKHTPLLVIGGGKDAIFPAHEVQATARAYGVEARIYPDMAHNLMAERGWEGVAGDIGGWLGNC